MKARARLALTVLVVTMLTSCTGQPRMWSKPGMTGATFEADDRACLDAATRVERVEASQSGGTLRTVNTNQYRECLRAKGYDWVKSPDEWWMTPSAPPRKGLGGY